MFNFRKLRWQLLVMFITVCVYTGLTVSVATAKEPATPEMTLNQAISLALTNSNAVKKADNAIEITQASKDNATSNVTTIPTSSLGVGNIEVESAYTNLLNADLNYQVSKKSLTTQQDAIFLSTCNKYWAILINLEKVKSAESGLENARLQLQNARSGYQIGTISQVTLQASETQYQTANVTLLGVQNSLVKAYTAFNQLVGLWPEDRPVLTDKVVYQPLEVASVDIEVNKALDASPTVWQAEENAKMQEYIATRTPGTGSSYTPYIARLAQADQARLDADSAQKALDQSTRTIYYNIIDLENSIAQAQTGIKTAEDNLRVKKLMFDIGMATTVEVKTCEKLLADAQSGLFELVCNHAYMELTLQKPWAV